MGLKGKQACALLCHALAELWSLYLEGEPAAGQRQEINNCQDWRGYGHQQARYPGGARMMSSLVDQSKRPTRGVGRVHGKNVSTSCDREWVGGGEVRTAGCPSHQLASQLLSCLVPWYRSSSGWMLRQFRRKVRDNSAAYLQRAVLSPTPGGASMPALLPHHSMSAGAGSMYCSCYGPPSYLYHSGPRGQGPSKH